MTDADIVTVYAWNCGLEQIPADTKYGKIAREANDRIWSLVAERDEARQIIKNIEPPYMEATQGFIDTICHYRNLAISLGAKPDDMANSWDRKLAESGLGDGDGGWDNDAPDVWLQLEAAEAEVARLKEFMACADTPLMRDVLAERDEWKREAELSKWPKEAAQEYHRMKVDLPAAEAERDALAVSIGFWEAEVARLREALGVYAERTNDYFVARAALGKDA
jgi:hypothetical protein